MALINCLECKKEISDSVKSCPHCGFSINKKKSNWLTWTLGVIAIIMAVIYYNISTNVSNNSYKSENYKSYTSLTVDVSVENVRISKDHNNAWAVKGAIRNNTTHSIKGAVKIKFINSKGDIVHTNRAYVNDGDSFESGQAANFEYFVSPETFDDVVDFKIEFY
ncbi:zinc ribbon domain-containing protein [Ancylomarina sp. DW003]|nr:hypothetical protein [Ancylomarina sp. DW003]MDE5423360.1 zinc ribbon domain-containing protein [Ancylomarina sp. DW003]